MKKIIFVSLLLVGFSAFAFCPNYSGNAQSTLTKTEKPRHSPLPAADMVMFPHLSM